MYQDNLNVQGELSVKDRILEARNRIANPNQAEALPPTQQDDMLPASQPDEDDDGD